MYSYLFFYMYTCFILTFYIGVLYVLLLLFFIVFSLHIGKFVDLTLLLIYIDFVVFFKLYV